MSKTGRPRFQPTIAQRIQCELGVAAGMSEQDIAIAIGINRRTLRARFKRELATGRARLRLHNLSLLLAAANKGNVSAMKYLNFVIETAYPSADVSVPTAAPKLGKKAQAQLDALTSARGTDWEGLVSDDGWPQ